jgi:hypothetical protein
LREPPDLIRPSSASVYRWQSRVQRRPWPEELILESPPRTI